MKLWFRDVEAAQSVLSWCQVDCWRDVIVRVHSGLMRGSIDIDVDGVHFLPALRMITEERPTKSYCSVMVVRPRSIRVLVQRQVVNVQYVGRIFGS